MTRLPVSQPVLGYPTPAPAPGGTLTQPVLGGPQPVTQPGAQTPQQPPLSAGGQTFTPTPNPYNLPGDLVGGQPQQQQYQGLLGQFESARQRANLANQARYLQGLQGYGQLEQDYAARTRGLMGELQGFGEAQQQALQDRFEQQRAGLTQSLIGRGLYNTTALEGAQQGLSRQQQRQQLQLDDMLRRQRMEYGMALTGQELANRPRRLEFMERRTDIGPSYQDVAGVAGAVGASQAAIPDYLSALGAAGTPAPSTPVTGAPTTPGTGAPGTPGTGLPAVPGLPQIPEGPRSPTNPDVDLSFSGPGIRAPNIRVARGTRTGPVGGGVSRGGGGGGGGGGAARGSGEFDAFTGRTSRGTTTPTSTAGQRQRISGGAPLGSGTRVVSQPGAGYFSGYTGGIYGTAQEAAGARPGNEGQQVNIEAEGTPTPEGSQLTIGGQTINIPSRSEDDGTWYQGKPPIYWQYFYGNVPGVSISAGQRIASQIAERMR